MKHIYLVLLILISNTLSAQNLTQTIRGTIVDEHTQMQLVGVLVEAYIDSTKSGAITDVDGKFKLKEMPIGRYVLIFSYLGYENTGVSQLEVTSTKETILNIEMMEKVTTTATIIVRARNAKSKTINQMVTVSGRTFSI